MSDRAKTWSHKSVDYTIDILILQNVYALYTSYSTSLKEAKESAHTFSQDV